MEKVYTYQGGVSFGGDVPTAEFDFEMSYQLGENGAVIAAEIITVDGKPRPWDRCDGTPDDELADAIIEHLDFIGVDLAAHAVETEASVDTLKALAAEVIAKRAEAAGEHQFATEVRAGMWGADNRNDIRSIFERLSAGEAISK